MCRRSRRRYHIRRAIAVAVGVESVVAVGAHVAVVGDAICVGVVSRRRRAVVARVGAPVAVASRRRCRRRYWCNEAIGDPVAICIRAVVCAGAGVVRLAHAVAIAVDAWRVCAGVGLASEAVAVEITGGVAGVRACVGGVVAGAAGGVAADIPLESATLASSPASGSPHDDAAVQRRGVAKRIWQWSRFMGRPCRC
ncbi:MAG: hypothetical protein H6674_11200 [Dehalococcoidia bacterium]|nr:hypothetical protein [Dehalococcoidia bacterium]